MLYFKGYDNIDLYIPDNRVILHVEDKLDILDMFGSTSWTSWTFWTSWTSLTSWTFWTYSCWKSWTYQTCQIRLTLRTSWTYRTCASHVSNPSLMQIQSQSCRSCISNPCAQFNCGEYTFRIHDAWTIQWRAPGI